MITNNMNPYKPNNVIFYLILLTFGFALLSFIAGIIFTPSIKEGDYYLSNHILILIIVVPFSMAIIGFILQLFLYRRDQKEQLEIYKANIGIIKKSSEFFKILEKIEMDDPFYSLIYLKLIKQFQKDITDLNDGIYTDKAEFWSLANDFCLKTKNNLECTSIIPLHLWKSKNVQDYYKLQIDTLIIKKKKPIYRTFIFEKYDDKEMLEFSEEVFVKQISDGVKIFLLFKDYENKIIPDDTWNKINIDLALIDELYFIVAEFDGSEVNGYTYKMYNSVPKEIIFYIQQNRIPIQDCNQKGFSNGLKALLNKK